MIYWWSLREADKTQHIMSRLLKLPAVLMCFVLVCTALRVVQHTINRMLKLLAALLMCFGYYSFQTVASHSEQDA